MMFQEDACALTVMSGVFMAARAPAWRSCVCRERRPLLNTASVRRAAPLLVYCIFFAVLLVMNALHVRQCSIFVAVVLMVNAFLTTNRRLRWLLAIVGRLRCVQNRVYKIVRKLVATPNLSYRILTLFFKTIGLMRYYFNSRLSTLAQFGTRP